MALSQSQTYYIEIIGKDSMQFLKIQLLYHKNIFMFVYKLFQ